MKRQMSNANRQPALACGGRMRSRSLSLCHQREEVISHVMQSKRVAKGCQHLKCQVMALLLDCYWSVLTFEHHWGSGEECWKVKAQSFLTEHTACWRQKIEVLIYVWSCETSGIICITVYPIICPFWEIFLSFKAFYQKMNVLRLIDCKLQQLG